MVTRELLKPNGPIKVNQKGDPKSQGKKFFKNRNFWPKPTPMENKNWVCNFKKESGFVCVKSKEAFFKGIKVPLFKLRQAFFLKLESG